jgi:hypothetical protein
MHLRLRQSDRSQANQVYLDIDSCRINGAMPQDVGDGFEIYTAAKQSRRCGVP